MTLHRSHPGLVRAAALAAVVAIAGCTPFIEGNGVFREEDWTDDVGDFAGVVVSDGIAAVVTVGGERSVKLSGDENVVTNVDVDTPTDRATGLTVLRVRISERYTTFHPLRVVVTLPELSVIRASGSSDEEGTESTVLATAVQSATLTVSVSDRAHVEVVGAGAGPASRLVATVSDRSEDDDVQAELDAHLYPVADVDVTLSDGARAWVNATASVSGDAPAGTSVLNTGAGMCLVPDGAGGTLPSPTCQR